MAEEGKLDPVVGREIERVCQILSRRKKEQPVLIGELELENQLLLKV
jgi:ATP-dependent Clp protease ATP-binding subunit ClpC